MTRHISRADLRTMRVDEILRAKDAGELAHLLEPEKVDVAELATWDTADLVSARDEGRLRHLGVDPEEGGHGGADQGARGIGPTRDRSAASRLRAEIHTMRPEEIVRLQRDGSLAPLLRGDDLS